jgi:nucleoside-triphosphatase THEP1
MVKIVTGKINSYKTTRLLNLYNEINEGDGFIATKTMKDNLVYGYTLVRLSDGYEMDLVIRDIFDDSTKPIIYQLGPYHFYQEAFVFIHNEIKRFINLGISPVFLDEISLLELNNMGYYQGLIALLKQDIDLYLVIREDLLEKVLKKFNINEYEIV